MRPKGGKDQTKRKSKIFLKSKEELKIIEQYNSGYSLGKLAKVYNISKSTISSLFKKRNIKLRVNIKDIVGWETISDINLINSDTSGVYGICFINQKDHNDIKLYIGSSSNIKRRLTDHYKLLNSGNHDSKMMQKYFNNKNYNYNFLIIEKCDPQYIMQKEGAYQSSYNKSCLLNSWLATNVEHLLPWLQKAITLNSYKDYTENNDGCWESKNINKEGYGVLKVVAFRDWGPGKIKYFYNHRVAYWEKYGEYPELIRHKCHNKKCRNPDHLVCGNHRDNALDKRRDFPKEFETKWLEFNADLLKLSNYYDSRWSKNMKLGNNTISRQLYQWEIKLNLRKKYPEIIKNNKNRRFKILLGVNR